MCQNSNLVKDELMEISSIYSICTQSTVVDQIKTRVREKKIPTILAISVSCLCIFP